MNLLIELIESVFIIATATVAAAAAAAAAAQRHRKPGSLCVVYKDLCT